MDVVQDEPILSDEAEADAFSKDIQDGDHRRGSSGISKSAYLPLTLFVLLFGFSTTILFSTYTQYVFKRVSNDSREFNGSRCVVSPSDPSFAANEEAQKESSWILAQIQIAAGVPAIFMALLYGSFSDRYGRIPTLALPWIGCLIFSTLACAHVALDNGYWLFILGAAIFGLTGNFVTYIAGTFALIADMTPVHRRSIAIVALEAALGLSLVLGNFGSGYFIQAVGYKVPIYASCCLIFLCGLFFFFLREPERAIPVRREATVGAQVRAFFTHVCDTITSDFNRAVVVFFFLFSFFLQVLCYIGSMNINLLYLLNAPFCFTSVQLGLYLAIQGACFQLGSAGTAWLLRHRASDPTLAIIGFLSYFAGNIFKGAASSFTRPTDMAFIVISTVLGLASTLPAAMIRAILSKLFDLEHQGVIFAFTASAETLATILGGLLLNAVYTSTLSFLHGFVYYFMAAMNAVSIAFIIFGCRWQRRATLTEIGSSRFASF